MKNLIINLFLILSASSFPLYAEDCQVSTDARPFMTSHPELQSEIINKKDGQYSAILKNGDIVLAKFSTCSLGMSAHYFSMRELDNSELLERVRMFLSKVVASEPVANIVLSQLTGFSAAKFKNTVTLNGLGSQHQLIIKPSGSPLFKQHIQYDWIPPEF